MAAVLVCIGLAVAAIVVTGPLVLKVWDTKTSSPPPPVADSSGLVTERQFRLALQDEINADFDRAGAWRAARSDHLLIVRTILSCKNMLGLTAGMPPAVFEALLLDLAPDGSHLLPFEQTPAGPARVQVAGEGAPTAPDGKPEDGFKLAPTEEFVLSISDSISRARLLSVSEVSGTLPNAKGLWWTVLLVSGFATFFVTLQAKMRRPADPVPSKSGAKTSAEGGTATMTADKTGVPPEAAATTWQIRRYEFVALMAIALSIAGTTLTGLKSYYDPTRALVQNEYALRKLRSLHQQIILGTKCDPNQSTIAFADSKIPDGWATTLADLQVEIIPPYASAGGSPSRNSSQ